MMLTLEVKYNDYTTLMYNNGEHTMLHLIDARDAKRIVGHRPHHPRHKGAVPVLVHDVAACPAIHEVCSVDVVYNPCSHALLA